MPNKFNCLIKLKGWPITRYSYSYPEEFPTKDCLMKLKQLNKNIKIMQDNKKNDNKKYFQITFIVKGEALFNNKNEGTKQ